MALVHGYSSGEDEEISKDAFGLSSIHAAKKSRVDQPSLPIVTQAAPAVLSEVSSSLCNPYFLLMQSTGFTTSNLSSHAAHGHSDEREYPVQ